MTPIARSKPTVDQADLTAAWSQRSDGVVRYSTSLLFGDRHTAEDVAQETALRLWQHPQTLLRTGSLEGWLRTVARNIIIDRARRRGARALETPLDPDMLARTAETSRAAGEGLDPGADVAGHVLSRLSAHALLDHLNEPHRATVEAVYADGLSLHQAARRLGVPIGTIKSRCHDGLHRLRRQLEAEGITPDVVLT